MRYAFRCTKEGCKKEFDHDLSMQVVSTPQEPPTFCPFCGTKAERLITGGGGFILRGHAWSGKASKSKRDHLRRSQELEVRQYERYGLHGGAELVPNYKKQIFDSWRDVKKAAESDAHAEGRPLDPMHEHMEEKEKLLKQVTTKTQVQTSVPLRTVVTPTKVATPAKVTTPTKVVSQAPALRKTFKVE